MPLLSILSPADQRKFDAPPTFQRDERQVFLTLTPELRRLLRGIHKPSNQIGLILQLGYFCATARFFAAAQFRQRDIRFVAQQLGCTDVDLSDYTGTVVMRHRQLILKQLGWRAWDSESHALLQSQGEQLSQQQFRPLVLLQALVDYCWKQRIERPSYHVFASIITRSYNDTEMQLLQRLESAITREDRHVLDELLTLAARDSGRAFRKLTTLKSIDQSLKPAAIAENAKAAQHFRTLFETVQPTLNALELSDRAVEYYATWLTKAEVKQLLQFTNPWKKYLYLLAFVRHQCFARQDTQADILLKTVNAAVNTAKRISKERDQLTRVDQQRAILALSQSHRQASEVLNAIVAIVQDAAITATDKYARIEQLIHDYQHQQDEQKQTLLDKLEQQITRETQEKFWFDALAAVAVTLQRRLTPVLLALKFTEQPASPLLYALLQFQEAEGSVGAQAPLAFLTSAEISALEQIDAERRAALYTTLLLIHTAKALKAGRVNLVYSYRYRTIDSYLIDPATWRNDRERILRETGLDKFDDGAALLRRLKDRLDAQYTHVNRRFLAGDNKWLSVSDSGRAHVRTPATDFDTSTTIATTLKQNGIVPILQILRDVDALCDFSSSFSHYAVKNVKSAPDQTTILAGLIGQGCNIGITKLASISSGLNEHSLRSTVNWYFQLENLKAANRKIVAAINRLALSEAFVNQPGVLHSSSDGRKVGVSVDSLHANFSYKYFGNDKGVAVYTFIDERQALFHSTVISASDREAAFVIDGLLQNEVDAEVIHSTDTHGYTETVFTATYLLDMAFAPRIKKVGHQTLYGFSAPQTLRKKGYRIVPSRAINQKLILEHWDDILRFMATIKSHHTTASQLFKRLSSYAADHPLYQALKEFGRIIKSQFILTWFDDLELRQQVQKQLNRIELSNRFSGAVFFDSDGDFHDEMPEDQEIATACKVLLQNAIVLWNYLYLSSLLVQMDDEDDRREFVDTIRKGSVITWRHVNLRGEYNFSEDAANESGFDFEKILALNIK